jgi:ABC-type multidrug transport system ATPase subunit
MYLLRARGLVIGYRSFFNTQRLLTIDVLEIEEKSRLLFYGPNGIGKTTFAKTLAGLLKPLGGWLERRLGPEDVFLVPEANDLPPTLRPMQFIKAVCDLYGARCGSMDLSAFGVPDVKIGHLSQGQRRRVYFALAVALDRRLTIFDDPLVHVDERGVALFADVLKALGGAVVVFVRPEHVDLIGAEVKVDLRRYV